MKRLVLAIGALLFALAVSSHASVQSNSTPAELTLEESVHLALQQNPAVLKAQQELRRTRGLIVEARSYNLPQVTANAQYSALFPQEIDKSHINLGITNVTAEFKSQQQPWNVQIEVSQTIFSGGRIAAGIRSAKLSDQIALLGYQRTVADTVLDVRKAFYRILLAREQVVVHEQSTNLLARQLEDTRHRFDAGDVPRFNVLRAEVELANARPPLIRSQNDFRLAKENLVKLLALDTPAQRADFTPILFNGQLAYQEQSWDLTNALTEALAKRPEIQQAEKQTGIAAEDIKTAQSGDKPDIAIFGGYQAYDSTFDSSVTDAHDNWIVGAKASWNIFDGQLTRGRVSQARARRQEAVIDLADIRRNIEFEVRQAFSDYLQARELFDAQKKTVEQADESLRLAEARFRAGTGTQLDVLSAQTALTEARSNEIEALYDYNVAVATIQRATGNTVQINP